MAKDEYFVAQSVEFLEPRDGQHVRLDMKDSDGKLIRLVLPTPEAPQIGVGILMYSIGSARNLPREAQVEYAAKSSAILETMPLEAVTARAGKSEFDGHISVHFYLGATALRFELATDGAQNLLASLTSTLEAAGR